MTNNKQQTAVEWGIEKLASLTFDYMAGFISKREYDQLSKGVIRQAKEMENKQSIKDKLELSASLVKNKEQQHETTWIAALDYGIGKMKGLNNLTSEDAFEQYYNETYGGGEQ